MGYCGFEIITTYLINGNFVSGLWCITAYHVHVAYFSSPEGMCDMETRNVAAIAAAEKDINHH